MLERSKSIPDGMTRRKFSTVVAASAVASAGIAVPAKAAVAPARSRKKGCCIKTRSKAHWPGMVQQLRPAWMYSWGLKRPEGLDKKIEFVPMVWGNQKTEKFHKSIDELQDLAKEKKIKHLLGFNEPDKKSQSNIEVRDAIDRWPMMMEVPVPLISPSCAKPDGKWMDSFMLAAEKKKLRVDAVGFHSYGGASPELLVNRLVKVYRRYGRPIWITEFAVGDWQAKSVNQNRFKANRVAAFMRELLPALDELKFVHRYAWFTAAPSNKALGTSALFDANWKNLTPLGKIYAKN
jgi:hypothetical protein